MLIKPLVGSLTRLPHHHLATYWTVQDDALLASNFTHNNYNGMRRRMQRFNGELCLCCCRVLDGKVRTWFLTTNSENRLDREAASEEVDEPPWADQNHELKTVSEICVDYEDMHLVLPRLNSTAPESVRTAVRRWW